MNRNNRRKRDRGVRGMEPSASATKTFMERKGGYSISISISNGFRSW